MTEIISGHLGEIQSRPRPYSLNYCLQRPNKSQCEQTLGDSGKEELPFKRQKTRAEPGSG